MSTGNQEYRSLFAPERTGEPESKPASARGWKVLLVDDEKEVHQVTKLALSDFTFERRPLSFLHAYSAKEAREILERHDDIAVALVDVVMEHEQAGLDLVRHIREQASNRLLRIVLRTGQPGQAPERRVISEFDINDYKEKTELSSQKLYSCVYTALRSYRDLAALDANRKGLERVIRASSEIFRLAELKKFIQGVLEQLVALLYLGQDAAYLNCDGVALERTADRMTIMAATGRYAAFVGGDAKTSLDTQALSVVREALENKQTVLRNGAYVAYFSPDNEHEDVLYICTDEPLDEEAHHLVTLFCQNALIAYQNVLLRDEIEGTQKDIVYMLGESIETRSRETGQHVRRVSEYSRLLAVGAGLSEREAEIVQLASPLHDFGKIGVPDHILHKPGKLEEEEWAIMMQHAAIGENLLRGSKREILKAAAIIAGQHHEKWDGSGYPNRLRGEEIHLYGRISAVADVFDALGTRRCYKDAWPLERIIDYLREQRGRHFDPALVDWALGNIPVLAAVRETFPD